MNHTCRHTRLSAPVEVGMNVVVRQLVQLQFGYKWKTRPMIKKVKHFEFYSRKRLLHAKGLRSVFSPNLTLSARVTDSVGDNPLFPKPTDWSHPFFFLFFSSAETKWLFWPQPFTFFQRVHLLIITISHFQRLKIQFTISSLVSKEGRLYTINIGITARGDRVWILVCCSPSFSKD